MTALDAINPVYRDGKAAGVSLFPIDRVSTDDTLDLATYCPTIKAAVVLGGTQSDLNSPVSFSGTVITFDVTGLDNDATWLLVWGSTGEPYNVYPQ